MAKKSSSEQTGILSTLDLVEEEDNVRYVALTLGMSFYVNQPLSSISKQVLQIQDMFLAWCPREEVKFFQTESMSRFQKVTEKTLGMLAAWYKKSVKPRDLMGLILKNGSDSRDAPDWKFQILGEENEQGKESEWPNLISLAFPALYGQERAEDILMWSRQLAELIPYHAAHIGYSFEICPFAEEESHTHAWSQSMKHPGIDIHLGGRDDTIATGRNALKTVNWLTLLGEELADSLGGSKALQKATGKLCTVQEWPGGVMIQAGEAPGTGQVNKKDLLPAYRAAFQAVKPLIQQAAEQASWLTLAKNEEERTQRWYLRFEDGK